MFNNNIVKLKKDLFIEAESIAYLVNDVFKRKLTFANTITLMAFHRYAEKNNYPQQITTKLNLFTIPTVAEKFGISDIYLDDIRIEVRASLDGYVFPLPKIQVKNALTADYIVVFKGTKNPLKCEALGYMTKEDLIFDSQDDDYYYISVSLLNPLEELKEKLSDKVSEEKKFFETEHKIAIENFGAFIDGDLEDVKSVDLIKHVLDCPDCRAYFVEYNYLEDILRGIKHYPEIEAQYLDKTDLEKTDNNTTNTNIEQNKGILDDISNTADTISEIASVASDIVTTEIATQGAAAETLEEITENIASDLINDESDIFEINDVTNDIFQDNETIDLDENNIQEEYFEIVDDISEETTNDNLALDNTNSSNEVLLDIPESSNTDTLTSEFDIIDLADEKSLTDDANKTTDNDLQVFEENNMATDNEENFIDLSSETDMISDDKKDENILEIEPVEENSYNTSNEIENNATKYDATENTIPLEDQLILLDENEKNNMIGTENDEILQQNNENQTISDIQTEPSGFNEIIDDNMPVEITDFSEFASENNDLNFDLGENSNIEISYSNDNDYFNEPSGYPQEQTFDEPQESSINLHELYTNNIGTQESKDIPVTKDIGNFDIEEKSAEDFFNTQEQDKPILKDVVTPEKEQEKQKNIKKGFIISIVAIILFLSGGLLALNFTKNNMGKTSDEIVDNKLINDGQARDINETVANTFKDAQFGRKVTKISWEVEKSLSTNPDASEYLTMIGQSTGDSIDAGVQDILLPTPPMQTKVLIKVNKMGTVDKVIFAESSGSQDLDNIIEGSVRQAFSSTPMVKYVNLTKDTNLIIVVNF